MASVLYCQHLTCSICLSIFTDPVTLPCGHSFCRLCITDTRNTQRFCPECRAPLPLEESSLPTSHILKSLAEKAKDTETMRKEHEQENVEAAMLCPEHEEKLKLFCVTDQQLACVICRDGENHRNHTFKPVEEAVLSLRKKLEAVVRSVSSDVSATEELVTNQSEEIAKTKEKSKQLMTHICRQFGEMHAFLREKEEEIKKELKLKEDDAVRRMTKTLNAIETAVMENLVVEGKFASALEITDSYRFLQWWSENNSEPPEHLFRPRVNDFQVVKTYLSLGPYESHLQFFVWKEMLRVVQPRAEQLLLDRNTSDLTVSEDGRSLICSPKITSLVPNAIIGHGQTNTQFGSGAGFGQSKTNPPFGSGGGSSQSKRSSLFGQTTTTPLSGSVARVGQFKAIPSFATRAGFGQSNAYSSVSSGAGFGQSNTYSSVSSGAGFAQTTTTPAVNPDGVFGQLMANPFFGPSARSGQNKTNPPFGLVAGSTQTMTNPSPSFGQSMANQSLGSSAGFGQTMKSNKCNTFSVNKFLSGQHYWEIEVGHREYWELGIRDHFLRYNDQKYSTCTSKTITELLFEERPRKIGIYLNCSSKKISFYDADNMTHIDTLSSRTMSSPVSAYFSVSYRTQDPNPMTVCWY